MEGALTPSYFVETTKVHEYLFLLSKSARYYFDHRAIMEAAKYDGNNIATLSVRNKRSVWTAPTQSFRGAHFATCRRP
ncbi:MAG: hypothetical protein LBD91_03190 [Prevotellaceae bacterium]|nr:hypothetical protein [Prevotellaceae bacterium]